MSCRLVSPRMKCITWVREVFYSEIQLPILRETELRFYEWGRREVLITLSRNVADNVALLFRACLHYYSEHSEYSTIPSIQFLDVSGLFHSFPLPPFGRLRPLLRSSKSCRRAARRERSESGGRVP